MFDFLVLAGFSIRLLLFFLVLLVLLLFLLLLFGFSEIISYSKEKAERRD